jgi:segregation and condensation protein A
MEAIQLKLDVYDGPLDLLLSLIQKLEVDIYDIPIAEITKQYMAQIHAMKELELEVAGEYIVMASTLMAIKSKMLLPTETYEGEETEEEQGVDPREELVAQLLEYRKFKFAATKLSALEEERALYFTKDPMDLSDYVEEDTGRLEDEQYNTMDLFFAFHQMLEKKKARKPMDTTIEHDEISIEDRMDEIVHSLRTKFKKAPKSGMSFDSFFEEDANKSEIVTTFMAMLELIKKKQIHIEQASNYEPILLFANEELMEGAELVNV